MATKNYYVNNYTLNYFTYYTVSYFNSYNDISSTKTLPSVTATTAYLDNVGLTYTCYAIYKYMKNNSDNFKKNGPDINIKNLYFTSYNRYVNNSELELAGRYIHSTILKYPKYDFSSGTGTSLPALYITSLNAINITSGTSYSGSISGGGTGVGVMVYSNEKLQICFRVENKTSTKPDIEFTFQSTITNTNFSDFTCDYTNSDVGSGSFTLMDIPYGIFDVTLTITFNQSTDTGKNSLNISGTSGGGNTNVINVNYSNTNRS